MPERSSKNITKSEVFGLTRLKDEAVPRSGYRMKTGFSLNAVAILNQCNQVLIQQSFGDATPGCLHAGRALAGDAEIQRSLEGGAYAYLAEKHASGTDVCRRFGRFMREKSAFNRRSLRIWRSTWANNRSPTGRTNSFDKSPKEKGIALSENGYSSPKKQLRFTSSPSWRN